RLCLEPPDRRAASLHGARFRPPAALVEPPTGAAAQGHCPHLDGGRFPRLPIPEHAPGAAAGLASSGGPAAFAAQSWPYFDSGAVVGGEETAGFVVTYTWLLPWNWAFRW